MTKHDKKKLQLETRTLRDLTVEELRRAAGGARGYDQELKSWYCG
jgi:hypothetical protein